MPVLGEHQVVVMQGSVPEAELAGLKGSDSYKHNKNPDWWMLHTG